MGKLNNEKEIIKSIGTIQNCQEPNNEITFQLEQLRGGEEGRDGLINGQLARA